MKSVRVHWFHFRAHDRTAGIRQQVIRDLKALAGCTEKDFLHLGEHLQEIVRSAQEQRHGLAVLLEAAAATSGEDFAEVLQQVSRWTGKTAGDASGARFRDLVSMVRGAADPLRSLDQAVRALRVVGVMTRMESARLGSEGSGFGALANEVQNLAASIEQKSTAIGEAVEGVSELLSQAQRTNAEIVQRQQRGMRTMTAESSEAFSQLRHEQQRVEQTALATQERYDQFAAEVGNMVAALQIHDSTRQRIEHIVEALDGPTEGAIIGLQILQLSDTSQLFMRAIDGIHADLDRFAQIIGECTRTAQDTLVDRKGSRTNFMSDLQQRFTAIASAIAEVEESCRASVKVGAEVEQACARMNRFVCEIESIGGRLLRLALNAAIQAVHLGATGVVMEAVTEGIRGTSENASDCARIVGGSLREMAAAASRFSVEGADEGGTAQASALTARLHRLAADLKRAEHTSTSILDSIAAGAKHLSERIASLHCGITAGRIFSEVAERCLASMREMAAAFDQKQPGKFLIQAAGRYTMQVERRVHHKFTCESGGRCASSDGGSDLGENVELF